MEYAIEVVKHHALSSRDLRGLRRLFDHEYADEFGPWDVEQPYGYAGHDLPVIARSGGDLVGHVGWARRVIGVGRSELTIAGVGGVLVAPEARAERLGGRLMSGAAESMSEAGGVDFGFLGCREEVVPFYASRGWRRISAAEHVISRNGLPMVHPPGPPLLVLPIDRDIEEWPAGTIDLRGRPW